VSDHTSKPDLKFCSRFLATFNRAIDIKTLLTNLVLDVKNVSGCSVSAIRLVDEKGNIPYRAHSGFADGFYELENALSLVSDQCMCINVIKGTVDPTRPFYTSFGSFYMNATTSFLVSVPDNEKGTTRNACSAFGYESVALIPIKSGSKIIGLIHVADEHENMVPLELVNRLEMVTPEIGIAIERLLDTEELQRSKQYYYSLVNNIPAGYFVVDTAGCVLDLNSSLLNTIGFSREEVLGKPFGYFIVEEQRALFHERFDRFKNQGELHIECKVVHKNRGHAEISVTGYSDLSNDGTCWKGYCFTVDVTERKMTERELRKVAALPLINPNPVIQVSPEGIVEFTNSAAKPILEYWHTRYGQSLPADWQKEVHQVFQTGIMKTKEIQYLGHVYDLKLFPVQEQGLVNIYGIDITRRYRQFEQNK
jgi:PAS domain S-box-containing protein